jgi:mannosylglucosylglycerate synthase
MQEEVDPMKRNRLAILHFASPPVIGGVESTVYHHARLLSELDFQVEVFSGRGEEFNPDVPVHIIPEIDSRHPEILSIARDLAAGEVTPEFTELQRRLTNALAGYLSDVDACIVHNAITLHKNLPLTAALRSLSDEGETPLIAWCHDFAWQDRLYLPDLHPGYPWDLLRQPWPGVKYVAVSSHRRERLAVLLGLPGHDIEVITPGVDVPDFLQLAPLTRRLVYQLDLFSADPIILLPARITRRKNIQFAIRVVGAIKEVKPNPALIVTGPPGPHNPTNIAYLASLSSLADDLGVSKNIHFLYKFGEEDQPLYLPDQVVSDFYRIVDLLLFPSRSEGFGIPVLEAGLSRIPIFAADIPPFQESAGGFANLFDPDGDPLVVAQAILSHLESNRVYHLRRRVLEEYSWKVIIENKVIPLLKEVIHGTRWT